MRYRHILFFIQPVKIPSLVFIADDAKYLLMTDFFSPYYSLLSKSAAFIMQSTQFPPLYPFLLAILGASSENLLLASYSDDKLLSRGIGYFL